MPGGLNMATSVCLAPDVARRLECLAAQTSRSKASLLRELIEYGIDDVEDYYLAANAPEKV
jgi:RHH-type rel operon transcriptional repressor/antitoxin RelB